MYFKRDEIKKVKAHVGKRAEEIGVILFDDDYQMYETAIASIIEDQGRKYNEGESLKGDHSDALKDLVKKAVKNYASSVIYEAKSGRGPKNPINDPTEHLLSLTDYYYVTAMQKLGCPNMQVFAFDKDIKEAMQEAAFSMDRYFHKYEMSKEAEFTQQRGKNASELEKRLAIHTKAIKNQDSSKPQHVGELIAEYQALKERQKNHGAIWRFFHRDENKARNTLLKSMAKTIRNSLSTVFPKEVYKTLESLNPADIARRLADARIRGNIEVAGVNRLDKKTKEIFGCLDAEGKIALEEKTEQDLSQEKVPMNKDAAFMAEIGEQKSEISQPINQEQAIEKENIIAKEEDFRLIGD